MEKPREIDVVGSFHNGWDDDCKLDIEISCLVECKHDKSKPWIGFVDEKGSARRFTWLHYPSSEQWRQVLLRNRRVFRQHEVSLFSRSNVAYGLSTVIFEKEKTIEAPAKPGARKEGQANPRNVAYEAAIGAAKAARYDLKAASDMESLVKFSVPVVVTETRLFTSSLNDAGDDFTVTEVDSFVYDVVIASEGLRAVPVHIVREHALPTFINTISKSVEQLNDAFKEPRFDSPPAIGDET